MSRVYVCHTYYHVLIASIKELLSAGNGDGGDILLSKMSTDFENLHKRLEESGVFRRVYLFDEKRDKYFDELMELKKDKGNPLLNMGSRIRYTKRLAQLLAPYVPINFHEYDDIYVFCDGDPIGTYLNQNKIHYHAVEDGLDTLRPCIQAKYDNKGMFGVKKFFSMVLNLIFICDGYSKYCLDMEVNDLSCINDVFYKYKEVPRQELFDKLNDEQKDILVNIFVKDYKGLKELIDKKSTNEKNILILSEPLCTLDVRRQIFSDLINEYDKFGTIFIKPHPRDELEYSKEFPEVWSFDRTIPMEIFKFFKELHFDKVISVYTQLANADFADEKIFLGHDFMDKYEDPSVHRK